MIDVTNLIQQKPLTGNYFAYDAYVSGDFEIGLVENRAGSRLIALPQLLLDAIYACLEEETGQAAGLVLYNCGRWWGKNFYRRFAQELSDYYDRPLAQMEMVQFLQSFKQCWKTHGWGLLAIELDYYDQGFLIVKTVNSAFAEVVSNNNTPACFVEAGILSAFFSQLSGRELAAVQTACESLGSEANYFVLGLAERVRPAQAWLEEGQDHKTILERLFRSQPV